MEEGTGRKEAALRNATRNKQTVSRVLFGEAQESDFWLLDKKKDGEDKWR